MSYTMANQIFRTVTSLVIGIIVATASASASQAQSCCRADGPAVYEAVLRDFVRSMDPAPELLVVMDSTFTPGVFSERAVADLGVPEPLASSYRERNRTSALIDLDWGGTTPVQIISHADIRRLPENREGRWETFWRLYPGATGYLELSRPGLNEDCTEALVDMIVRCGVLCGSGTVFRLRKEQNTWIIVSREVYSQS